jgi:hypothetical protein
MRRTAPDMLQRLSQALNAKHAGTHVVAFGKRFRPCKAVDCAPSAPAQLPVAVASRDLTPHETDQTANQTPCTPCKAHSALPSYRSGAAAAEYGSRHALLRATARSTASPWSSSRLQRATGSARRVFGTQPTAGLPSARPNPSLKLTRSGRHCKPGLSHSYYRLSPGLQYLPPRAA